MLRSLPGRVKKTDRNAGYSSFQRSPKLPGARFVFVFVFVMNKKFRLRVSERDNLSLKLSRFG